MVIVDTTIWIDYLGGFRTAQTDWLERELRRQRLAITDLILCEVLQGIRDNRLFDLTRNELLNFEVFSTGGLEMAITSAQNFRTLRSKGVTIRKTIDCWIATFCLLNGHTLLHNDRDYEPFEAILGLQVIHP
jgi:predicted nucleic acid-binding protein